MNKYLILDTYRQLGRNLVFQITYELGLLLGCLLWRNYVIDIKSEETQIYFTSDPMLIQALDALGQSEWFQKDTFVVVQGELFFSIISLIRYVKTSLVKDDIIGQSREFVRGLRDTTINGTVITQNKKLIDFLQKYIWYWFEQKIEGTSHRLIGRRRLYSFRIK